MPPSPWTFQQNANTFQTKQCFVRYVFGSDRLRQTAGSSSISKSCRSSSKQTAWQLKFQREMNMATLPKRRNKHWAFHRGCAALMRSLSTRMCIRVGPIYGHERTTKVEHQHHHLHQSLHPEKQQHDSSTGVQHLHQSLHKQQQQQHLQDKEHQQHVQQLTTGMAWGTTQGPMREAKKYIAAEAQGVV